MSVELQVLQHRIFLIRGRRVMLDTDLASLYGTTTKKLLQQVRRNQDRFPEEFAFQLTREEFANLRSQTVTSSWPETEAAGARRQIGFHVKDSATGKKAAIGI